jgi:EAL and modified HD-GYP domain-containing signal transduction protein
MPALIARQPIFDLRGRIFAYELLYRGPEITSPDRGNVATARVICEALGEIGLDRLAGSGSLFINFDQNLIESGAPAVLPRARSVIEILEDVDATESLVELVADLRMSGIKIALDDFCFQKGALALLAHTDFIKVDILAQADDLGSIAARLRPFGVPLVAEKVETRQQQALCRELGFSYFQGFFFAKPQRLRTARLESGQLIALQVLTELQREDGTPEDLAKVLARDVRLVHQLLRLANSAALGRRRMMRSITDAIILLGEHTLRQWASLLLLARLDSGKPQELLSVALARARLCEQLVEIVDAVPAHTAYMVGLLSVLDALLDRPMEAIIAELELAADVSQALLGDAGRPLGAVLACALDFERGNWDAVAGWSGPKKAALVNAYLASILHEIPCEAD